MAAEKEIRLKVERDGRKQLTRRTHKGESKTMRYNYYQAVEKLKAVRLESTMSWAYECIGAVLSGCTRNTLEILNDYERVYVESKNFKRKFDFELEIRARLCRVFEAIENGESVREYGEIVTAWVERKKAETALATETAQAETIADETPAVEVEPVQNELSRDADKYLASEMTADEVEGELNKADIETLREFALQREIPIDDNEDRAGMVKILMEELVCEKLGVYDTDPADKEICTELEEPEQPAPVIEAVKEETPAPAKVWLQRKHSWSILDKVACVERTDLTAKFAAKMVRIIDEQMQQERIRDLHNLLGYQWKDRYHATSAEWAAMLREKHRLELLRARYVERTYRVKELEELTVAEWSRLELEDLMWFEHGSGMEVLPEYMPEHERARVEAELTRRREADRPFLEAVIRHEKWLETPEGKAKMDRARMLNYGE